MTSDQSQASRSSNVDGLEEIHLSTVRQHYEISPHQRHHLHSKRSATVDPESNEEKIRIVILGATKVGKTCLCQQFLEAKFLVDHKETVDEMHSVELVLVDRRITLEILDTAGIDEFPVMRRIAIAHGDAFLILYAVDDAQSFGIARELRQLVLEVKGETSSLKAPMMIVANKIDVDFHRRQISRHYAEMIVCEQWQNDFMEISCQDHQSVLNAFRHLLQLANVHLAWNTDVTRRSSDPSLSSTTRATNKGSRTSTKRQSCAQQ